MRKKQIEKRNAAIFKQATEELFTTIQSKIFNWDQDKIRGVDSIHIEDIKFLDGYFIFDCGANSVVHFKIKECPGWLFGIWWQQPAKSKLHKRGLTLEGTFFTQYEKTSDKFKPTRSAIKEEISITLQKQPKTNSHQIDPIYTEGVCSMIRFIIKEPELAFCRDYCCWDYNREFHDRRAARREFERWKTWSENAEIQKAICNDKIITFIKTKVLPCYGTSVELVDRGEGWSPRYQPACRLANFTQHVDQPGRYSLNWEEEYPEIEAEWQALLKECEEVSNKYQFMYFNPVVDSCLVLNSSDFDHYIQTHSAED